MKVYRREPDLVWRVRTAFWGCRENKGRARRRALKAWEWLLSHVWHSVGDGSEQGGEAGEAAEALQPWGRISFFHWEQWRGHRRGGSRGQARSLSSSHISLSGRVRWGYWEATIGVQETEDGGLDQKSGRTAGQVWDTVQRQHGAPRWKIGHGVRGERSQGWVPFFNTYSARECWDHLSCILLWICWVHSGFGTSMRTCGRHWHIQSRLETPWRATAN